MHAPKCKCSEMACLVINLLVPKAILQEHFHRNILHIGSSHFASTFLMDSTSKLHNQVNFFQNKSKYGVFGIKGLTTVIGSEARKEF